MEKDPWFIEKDPRFSSIQKRIHGLKLRIRIHGLEKWNDTLLLTMTKAALCYTSPGDAMHDIVSNIFFK